MQNPRKLPIQYGCALALALTAGFLFIVAAGLAYDRQQPIPSDAFGLFEFVVVGLPFAVLAVARTRDWLAWLVAIALTSAGWGWLVYEASLDQGANIGGGFFIYIVAPLIISGASLTTAGLRGKIPDWGQEPEA